MLDELISRESLKESIKRIDWHSENHKGEGSPDEEKAYVRYAEIEAAIESAPAASAVLIPCKIGDLVWAIRCFKGVYQPQQGVVSEMFFTEDMRLQIVVKYVARGEWGKNVFATCEEATAAIQNKEIHKKEAW